MNRSTFDKQLLGMCEYFGKDLSESMIDVYWNALQYIPDDVFINAVGEVMMKNTFFPRLPEILKYVPKSEPLKLEEKAGLSWCANTQALMDKYPSEPRRSAA